MRPVLLRGANRQQAQIHPRLTQRANLLPRQRLPPQGSLLQGVHAVKIRNPNAKARKKSECRSPNRTACVPPAIRISHFELLSDFEFRVSDFMSLLFSSLLSVLLIAFRPIRRRWQFRFRLFAELAF